MRLPNCKSRPPFPARNGAIVAAFPAPAAGTPFAPRDSKPSARWFLTRQGSRRQASCKRRSSGELTTGPPNEGPWGPLRTTSRRTLANWSFIARCSTPPCFAGGRRRDRAVACAGRLCGRRRSGDFPIGRQRRASRTRKPRGPVSGRRRHRERSGRGVRREVRGRVAGDVFSRLDRRPERRGDVADATTCRPAAPARAR